MLTDWHKTLIIVGTLITVWGTIAAVVVVAILANTPDATVGEKRLSYLDWELMRTAFCEETGD